MYYGFEGLFPNMLQNFKDDGLEPIRHYCLLDNLVLLVTIYKFDPNAVLVNIKSKPYKFMEDKTLQVVLVKPNDLVMDEHVQTK
jgi:hypothetical protein